VNRPKVNIESTDYTDEYVITKDITYNPMPALAYMTITMPPEALKAIEGAEVAMTLGGVVVGSGVMRIEGSEAWVDMKIYDEKAKEMVNGQAESQCSFGAKSCAFKA
jgi:hypothetical protein